MVDKLTFPTTLLEMQRMFPDEKHCASYLEALRWPEGFVCRFCNAKDEPYRFMNRASVLRCRQCKRETALTAGTVMQKTRTPLLVWFWAAFLVTSQTPGMSALQIQRQLGISRYETMFQILHKLRAAMVRPDHDAIGAEHPVEVDETYVGGRTRGEGRGVHHKAIVVGAVEVRCLRENEDRASRGSEEHEGGRPLKRPTYAGRMRLQVVSDRKAKTLEGFITSNITSGALIRTDGWQGYDGIKELGFQHHSVVMEGDPERAEEHLPVIHLVFSNLKAWLLGTHHGVSQNHLQAYLNEYVFRFNRRFYPFSAFHSVLGIASKNRGPTYETLYSGAWLHPNSERDQA
jgi:transposase-like protein